MTARAAVDTGPCSPHRRGRSWLLGSLVLAVMAMTASYVPEGQAGWTKVGGTPPRFTRGTSTADVEGDRVLGLHAVSGYYGPSEYELWSFSLSEERWKAYPVTGPAPRRPSVFFTVRDPFDERLLVLASGEGGLETWVVRLDGELRWRRLEVEGPEPQNLGTGSHHAVLDRAGQQILVFVRRSSYDSRILSLPLLAPPRWREAPTEVPVGVPVFLGPSRRVLLFDGSWQEEEPIALLEVSGGAKWISVVPESDGGRAVDLRSYVSGAWDPVRRQALIMGIDSDSAFDAWFLEETDDGWRWKAADPDHLSGQREDHGLFYDEARDRYLAIGGSNDYNPWTYPGEADRAWRMIPPFGGQLPEGYTRGVLHDPLRRRVIFVHEVRKTYPQPDSLEVWSLSLDPPRTFVPVEHRGQAPVRAGASPDWMAYDPVDDALLVDGRGLGIHRLHLGDAPYWDTITQASYLSGPVVVDTRRHRLIAFGQLTHDLRVVNLTGTPWESTLMVEGYPPPRRTSPGVTYDHATDRAFVLGGYSASTKDIWMLQLGDEPRWEWSPGPDLETDPSIWRQAPVWDPLGQRLIAYSLARSLEPHAAWRSLLEEGEEDVDGVRLFDAAHNRLLSVQGTDLWALPLGEPSPVVLTATAEWTSTGARVEWRGAAATVQDFRVWRGREFSAAVEVFGIEGSSNRFWLVDPDAPSQGTSYWVEGLGASEYSFGPIWLSRRAEQVELRSAGLTGDGQSVRVRFVLPSASLVSAWVYDVRGRHVRQLARNVSYPQGSHDLVWDGTNDDGNRVASGVYLARFVAGPSHASTKVLWLAR